MQRLGATDGSGDTSKGHGPATTSRREMTRTIKAVLAIAALALLVTTITGG